MADGVTDPSHAVTHKLHYDELFQVFVKSANVPPNVRTPLHLKTSLYNFRWVGSDYLGARPLAPTSPHKI